PDQGDALDAIMEHRDVVARAEAGLDEEGRAWFSETLAEELRRLGNPPRYEARLAGSGAIARGDRARAVGKGGVLFKGDAQGDVVGDNKIVKYDQRGRRVKKTVQYRGMRVLWELAFEAHARGGKGEDSDALADIGERRLVKTLARLKRADRNWAMEPVETMKLRTGLLLERALEVFIFPHRTFQEYLAGVHLARMKSLT
ncbi:MAG: hypothetical protein GY859_09085, partial [Desulfobacterales bacterium]|nr:hypothetical protein [Desulfobacterales bacterium]